MLGAALAGGGSMTGLNLEVVSTTSGPESLIIAGQFNPGLVILDVNLLEVGGERVLSLLKQKMPDNKSKVLLVSGDQDALASGVEQGADGCLAKPFTPQDLVGKVINLLGIERRRRQM
jgi:DNA-binding response OmpR family regulator